MERGDEVAPTDLLADLRTAARKALGKDDETVVWKILGFYGLKGPDLGMLLYLMPDEASKTMRKGGGARLNIF